MTWTGTSWLLGKRPRPLTEAEAIRNLRPIGNARLYLMAGACGLSPTYRPQPSEDVEPFIEVVES